MFTHCPACIRQFRIRASQLAAAAGLVQCGFCGKQFNALERLYDRPLLLDAEVQGPSLVQESAEPDFYIPETEASGDAGVPDSVDKEEDEEDFIIELPAAEIEVQEPVSQFRFYAEPETDPGTPGEAASPEPAEEKNMVYPFPEELAEETAAPASRTTRIMWAVGVLLLTMIGAAQASWFNRDTLLSQYPQFLPYAKQLCQQIDCVLIRNRNISAIKILNRDVRVHPRYEDALLVNATITNLSNNVQRFPTVLLSLFDGNGKVIAYRQIPATEYLDNSIDIEAGMQADTPIHFVFEVADTGTDAVSFEFDFL